VISMLNSTGDEGGYDPSAGWLFMSIYLVTDRLRLKGLFYAGLT
jgi:hypothetical protein